MILARGLATSWARQIARSGVGYSFIFYMNVQKQIKEHITSQPEPKRSDMQELHRIIPDVMKNRAVRVLSRSRRAITKK